jgi:predicted nucleotidyltransferase
MVHFNVIGKIYSMSAEVESVALFGSVARGDFDSFSDIDLLIIIDDCTEDELIQTKKIMAYELEMPFHWLSVYRRSAIEYMSKYGSYFLWHVKVEGRILYSKEGFLENILDELPPYTRTREDLLDYLTVCNDIRQSVQKDDSTINYDLATLASIARNTCIALTYLYGRLEFGRTQCVHVSREIIGTGFPFSVHEYEELYHFRFLDTRGYNELQESADTTPEYVVQWLDKIERLIHLVLKKTKKEGDQNE